MKVFLSWSGKKSLYIATALRDWLPSVIQALEPWLSSEDITKGTRWATEISRALETTQIGIICVTRENLDSLWLNFEAGALVKRIDVSLACIYLFDVEPSEVSGPLSQFQCTRAEKDDTFKLILALNKAQGDMKLSREVLNAAFEVWWPSLEARFKEIGTLKSQDQRYLHSDREIHTEMLEILRRLDTVPASKKEGTWSEEKESTEPAQEEIRKPRVFIGSSSEGLPIAEVIQLGLDHVAECTLWTQETFGISQTAIESIVDASAKYDFSVLVLTPDDMTIKRGDTQPTARDNLIFELGLFTGALGRARTFMVFQRDKDLRIPTDLSGVTAATYSQRSDGNLEAALGPVCTRIKRAMGVEGIL